MTAELMTPTEVAEALDCTPETVNAKLAAHELPGVKVGRSWRIPRAALIEHLNAEARRNVRAQAPAVPTAQTPAAVGFGAPAPVHKRLRRQPPRLVSLSPAGPPGLPPAGTRSGA